MIMTEEDMGVEEVERVSSLKERLRLVADEIDGIKNSFSKNTENLSRIQGMLDVGNLEEISGIIKNFENRISNVERQKEEAADGARKYRDELEKEKERLIKLWDAYKNQEEELSTTEKNLAEFEERARQAEVSKKQLEEDLTARINTLNTKLRENEDKIKHFDDYKQRCEEFDDVRNQLEREVNSLKDEINTKDETIDSLQKQVDETKENQQYKEYKDRFDEISEQYEKEKDRLTKLYHLYEETETECKNLREEVKNWRNWYESNGEMFERLFSTAPPRASEEMPKNPLEETKQKSKKRLRFKK